MPRREHGDEGFVGGFAGLLFGVLLFVVGTLLAAYAWAIVDTKAATEEAARQAARTYVESPDANSAAARAEDAAEAALSGYGRNPTHARVTISSGSFVRCARVTVTVSYPAPLLDLPFAGRLGTGQSVRAEHSELIDPYRSGLPGAATC